ncbi:hypothetical protein HU200_023621 [Digitaria exilis]|uniref:BHLH domain-containing protein n=1 Tax=Digitaria exilis TaxID=1010633 RepID=A0A835EYB7_9POAL|nr:hypothetical protein HU200_023621 [Digitaria exilis]
MALLDAVVYPQPQGHFGYGLPWSDDAAGFGQWDPFLLASIVKNAEQWGEEEEEGSKGSPETDTAVEPPSPVTTTKRKRRRAKVVKNEEEIKSQRMTHIAVERNRRRLMNEYLAVLRSLMPPSYAQRGDQASIVGGAINYVRELEQLLQSLEVQRSLKEHTSNSSNAFAGFFSFPQYSSCSASYGVAGNHTIKEETSSRSPQSPSVTADIEASMVEGHASVKVQAPRRPRQLLVLAAGLQQLGLTTLHLNVSTAGTMVMYSFSLKVEDECNLSSVEEIAAAVHEILGRVQEETGFS